MRRLSQAFSERRPGVRGTDMRLVYRSPKKAHSTIALLPGVRATPVNEFALNPLG